MDDRTTERNTEVERSLWEAQRGITTCLGYGLGLEGFTHCVIISNYIVFKLQRHTEEVY